MRSLVVAFDALLALRDASGGKGVDLGAAATLAMLAGCDAVQVGVAEDGRPAGESEARELSRSAPVELRLAPTPSLAKVALEVRPARVVLAAESRDGAFGVPLDLRLAGPALGPAVRMLRDAGLKVGALIVPDLDAVKIAHAAHVEAADLFTGTTTDLPEPAKRGAIERLADAARLASKLRLEVGVSGALGLRDLAGLLTAAPVVERVVVGRAFVARAQLVGIERAAQAFREKL
jgi:pyridoxine 5'-phosphate synthase PdxJ